ncbi:MAG: hypothetical protein K6T71_01340 [Candidatus Bipolaricaulota bacterium]|nr:hypothetical protein [Candidatus Bipolaricaulota bacterium]
MEAAKFEAQLELARRQIRQVAQEFGLEYRPESYSFLFVSKRESYLRNYLAAPMYSEFGATEAERVQNLEKFLNSPLYTAVTGPGSTEGCVMTREELEDEQVVIAQIANPTLRAEYEALYDKLTRHMQGRFLTLFSWPETEWESQEGLAYMVLHEWLHVLLMDNGIFFQDRGKSWEWDEGLVTYLMAFLGKEDLDGSGKYAPQAVAEIEDQSHKAARRWREILKDKQTPKERRSAILQELEAR